MPGYAKIFITGIVASYLGLKRQNMGFDCTSGWDIIEKIMLVVVLVSRARAVGLIEPGTWLYYCGFHMHLDVV
jgi:hypothetical protein